MRTRITAITTSLALLLLGLGACSDGGPPPGDSSVDRPRREAGREGPPVDVRREGAMKDTHHERPGDGPRPLDAKADRPPAVDVAVGKGPLRVGTLNIQCLLNLPDTRAQGIALEVQQHDLDALAVQEICQTVGAGGSDSMAGKIVAALKTLTGQDWEVRWSQTHLSWSGKYEEGPGLIARKGSVLAAGDQLLYQAKDFPRKVVWAKIATARGAFYLYSTHLTISADWTERLKQVQSILALVNTHLADNLPQLVAGDFNDKDWSGPLLAMKAGPPAFTDTWATKNPGQPGNSIGCPNPTDRIDFIFARSAALKSLSTVQQLAKEYAGACLSDHVGLWTELFQQ